MKKKVYPFDTNFTWMLSEFEAELVKKHRIDTLTRVLRDLEAIRLPEACGAEQSRKEAIRHVQNAISRIA